MTRFALALAALLPTAAVAAPDADDLLAMARCVGLMDGYLEMARAGDYIDTEADAILTEANLADWAAITAHPAAAPEVEMTAARAGGRADHVRAVPLYEANPGDNWARSILLDATFACADVRVLLIRAGVIEE